MRTWLIGIALGLSMTAAHAAGAAKTVVFELKNFSCPACRITVEKALDRVPGVTARQVDAGAATARVTFDPARVSQSEVARAITQAGFPATAKAAGG